MKIGSLHYVDNNVSDTRTAGRSRDVYLAMEAGRWRVRTEGVDERKLPPGQTDRAAAVLAARQFIQSRKGTCLKHPK